jgi:putative membrane protein
MYDLIASLGLWIKALHVIAVIFWMAGMMYLPRLFVYHWQAKPGGELEETLIGQERRLLRIIINPAMILAFVFGLLLVVLRHDQLAGFSWLWVKLAGVLGLFYIHGILAADRKNFERGERPRSEKYYRVLNEAPAFLIIIIVIMAIVEPF